MQARSWQRQSKILWSFAGLSLLCATVAGAVASHVLTDLDERSLHSFETAVQFQFFHGLGLIGVELAREHGIRSRVLDAVAWLFVAGTLLFCGSIYAATLGMSRGVLSFAPYGGGALMLGWLLFAASPWLRARV